MRYLFIAVVVGGWGMGCATPRVAPVPPMSVEVERWQRLCQEERERADALAVRLAAVEASLEAVAQERAEFAQLQRVLEDELGRAATERQSLVEHNAQLVSRQRELTALQEELEDVWYQSALSRARRSQTQSPAVPPPTHVPAAHP